MKSIGLTQRVEVLKDRGERRDCLDQAWSELLIKNGFHVIALANQSEDPKALIEQLQLGGIILTGGNDLSHLSGGTNTAPERDKFESALLDACGEENIPVLGVCRGLQMMVHHYGGELSRVENHVRVKHGLVIENSTLMPLGEGRTVNSFHNFGVQKDDIGNELNIVASAPDGTVEALAHKTLRQWAIMWHPERDPHDDNDDFLIKEIFK